MVCRFAGMNHPYSVLPLTPQRISLDVLRDKYLWGTEQGVQAVFSRVARALASVEQPALRALWEGRFLRHLQRGAIGAGRIMSAAGTGREATCASCFVLPVGDALQCTDEQGLPGLDQALQEAGHTLRMGGGVGLDFSRVRPQGVDRPGPCGYIDAFEASCAGMSRIGDRRGAQMAVLRIDHPDVLDFIEAKSSPGRWAHFNLSIGVTDAFMDVLLHGPEGTPWDLVHQTEPGPSQQDAGSGRRGDGQWVYRRLPARLLWDRIMRAAYGQAEPGVLFLDRIQADNNLRALETLCATNPCGEQPLPPYGSCVLGPFILPRFVRHPFNRGGPAAFDFKAFGACVGLQVRALDNVLDLTRWPLPQQHREAQTKRRIGLGLTGLGDALVLLGLRYDGPPGRAMAARIARTLRDAAYSASIDLAAERGAFPLLDVAAYLADGTFASRLPASLQSRIRRQGIRNSHLLSIAPAGTVSLAFADNVSNGIEPAYAWTCSRHVRRPDGSLVAYAVEDHAWRLYAAGGGDVRSCPQAFVTALEMSPQAHVAMMQAVQPFIDAAISKTVNVPADLPYEAFKGLYLEAWLAGLKGLSAYRPNAVRGQVLQCSADLPAACSGFTPSA